MSGGGSVTGSLAVEVERSLLHFDHLRLICEETKGCLAQVDYEHHFDKTLYQNSTWSEDEDTEFRNLLCSYPKFIVLGSVSLAKAAVVNEILGCAILPTLFAEESTSILDIAESEGVAKANWHSVVVRYGPNSQYRRRSKEVELREDMTDTDLLSPVPFSPSPSGNTMSAVPLKRVKRGGGEGRVEVEVTLAHPLLKDGTEILIPDYTPDTDELIRVLHLHSLHSIPIIIYVLATSTLTDTDARDLGRLRNLYYRQPIFFIKSRPYVRSDLPESDRCYGVLGGGLTESGCSSVEESSGSWRDPDPWGRNYGNRQHPDFAPYAHNNKGHSHRGALGFGPGGPDVGLGGGSKRRPQFVTCHSAASSDSELDISDHGVSSPSQYCFGGSASLRQQLMEFGLLSPLSRRVMSTTYENLDPVLMSDLIENGKDFHRLIWFIQRVFRYRLVNLAAKCHVWQSSLLNLFILTAFDMARDQLITPKRLSYSKKQENQLYTQLVLATQKKQEELQTLFLQVLKTTEPIIVEEICAESWMEEVAESESEGEEVNQNEESTAIVQHFVVKRVNEAVAERFAVSLDCLRHTYIGTLTRCLEKLEESNFGDEHIRRQSLSAIAAFKQLLNAAYTVELSLPPRGSLVEILWLKIKQVGALPVFSCCFPMLSRSATPLPSSPSPSPSSSTATHSPLQDDSIPDDQLSPLILRGDVGDMLGGEGRLRDAQWRQKVAKETLCRLRDLKLAKVLCQQFREKIKLAHEGLQTALEKLYIVHADRLRITEEQRLKLRKQHAPRLARLTMESLALKDMTNYGMPKLGMELGRGQYGVVYACERWGSFGPCAVKSVVPPDDRHCNDLAMEFHYTKSLPEHERIVRLHGVVMDHNYGGGGGQPAVLLVMERLKRDLHTGLRQGLSSPVRLQLALDVIEGMRFLHSQGLVHRDIKLKNVLLDDNNRGKITDLGFCKPEAMMSGSVVGTPIHMAPELFSGNYDSSVDVYAFGVLFWYICAGHVRLPQAFEHCNSKDQLWLLVKRGLRPEQLSSFDNACWSIMRQCWSGDPNQRPHLGNLAPRLQALMDEYTKTTQPSVVTPEGVAPKSTIEFPEDRTLRAGRL